MTPFSVLMMSLTDPQLGADAIVNASNPRVGLGSGVSGAIRVACGDDGFQQLVRRAWADEFDEPLQPDDCLLTSAGAATAFRWVLHVLSVDYTPPDPETGGPSGPSRVRRCAAAAFREACTLAREQLHGRNVVLGMPLLGVAHEGLEAVASMRAILEGIGLAQEDDGLRDDARSVSVRLAVLDAESARVVKLALATP